MKNHLIQFVRALFADKHNNMLLLWEAAKQGNVDEVRRLIPISHCADWNSRPLINAVYGGHVECVRLLIPVSNPKDYNKALWFASGRDSVECVKLLLEVADPLHNNSQALQSAVIHKNQEIVDLLYPLSDPDAALKQILNKFKQTVGSSPYQDFIDRVEEGRFKRELTKAVEHKKETPTPSAPKRKM